MSLQGIKNYLAEGRHNLPGTRFENLLWFVDAIPTIAGFSIRKEKVGVVFWIIHLSILVYVYIIGNTVYLREYANGIEDHIKSCVNISILVLILNNSYWLLFKRSAIKQMLRQSKLNDALIGSTPELRANHLKRLKYIKYTLVIFYLTNHINGFFNYVPHLYKHSQESAIVPCYGFEPLTTSPNAEICLFIVLLQEVTVVTIVVNYQGLLVFTIAHTAVTISLLAEELLTFNTKDSQNIPIELPAIIRRHVQILDVVAKIKSLYSIPMGINFCSNAVCMAFFFFLPLQDWVSFLTIFVYSVMVFFLYCFLGQTLVNSAAVFERAVYACGWERFEIKERKMVYYMLMLAQRDVQILAGDIIPVNMYTFATTLQGMYKFVTVMKL